MRRPPVISTPLALAATAALLLASCAPARGPADRLVVRELTPPFLFALDAADPSLATDHRGHVVLTWVTPAPAEGQDLWLSMSRDSGLTFSRPVRLNAREGSVRSDPESRPVAAFGPRSELAVAWSERAGSGSASSLVVLTSGDGGMNLGRVTRVNDDAAWDTTGQHGFATLAFLSDGTLFAAWLEDRVMERSSRGAYWRWWNRRAALGGPPIAHQLMSSLSTDGGQTWGPNRMLADSACACCRPEARAGANAQVAIAYRRAVAGLRDPALIVADPGRGESRDTLVSADGWRLAGCPAQGPSVAWSEADGGLYAWSTEGGTPGVYVTPWRVPHGASGMKRRIDDGLDAARNPLLVPLGRETLIGVVGRAPGDTVREVFAIRALGERDGLTPWSFFGADVESPSLAALDDRTAFAGWVEREGDRGHVRVVRLRRR